MATVQQYSGEFTEMLLMGLTGAGKSATGNSILRRKQFKSKGGWRSITKEFHLGIADFEDHTLRVVDIPGFADTDEVQSDDKIKLVMTELSRALVQVRKGFHAVLLVVSYENRITTDEKSSILAFLDLFDKNAFKDNGVLVLTHGDQYINENEDIDVTDWIKGEGPTIQWLPELCSYRCVLFDNSTTDPEIQANQIRKLLTCIDGLKTKGAYIPKVFTLDEKQRKKHGVSATELETAETVMDGLSKLEYLISGDGSQENIDEVKEQAEAAYRLSIEYNLATSDDSIIVSMEQLSKTYDGSSEKRDKLSNTTKDLQLKVEAKMAETSYWQVVSQYIWAAIVPAYESVKSCSLM